MRGRPDRSGRGPRAALLLLALLVVPAGCVAGPLSSYVPPGPSVPVAGGSVRLYSDVSERAPLDLAAFSRAVEADIAAVEARLGMPVPAGLEVVVSADFEVEPGRFTRDLGRHVDGFYNRRRNIVFVEYRADLEGLRATLRHELAHAVVSTRYRGLPQWISEGVATTCEDLEDAPMQWARLLKFAARLRDRGPVRITELARGAVQDYSDYNDAWAAFYVLENWLAQPPMEVLRLWSDGDLDLDDADEQFEAFQRALRGRDGFRLEDVLGAVRPVDRLGPESAADLMGVLGQPRAQPVLVVANVGTILQMHQLALQAEGDRYDPRFARRILRQAIQPFLDPIIERELGERPRMHRKDSVRGALRRLAAAEDVYLELVDRLVPGARDLDIDLRPRTLSARHVDLNVWASRHRSTVARWVAEEGEDLIPESWFGGPGGGPASGR